MVSPQDLGLWDTFHPWDQPSGQCASSPRSYSDVVPVREATFYGIPGTDLVSEQPGPKGELYETSKQIYETTLNYLKYLRNI